MAHTKKSGTAAARDGAFLKYTIHGIANPGQPKIALIHSLGMAEFVWDSVVDALVDRALVLTYDCRGHGASAKSPGPYRVETFAQDLEDVMNHAGWQNAHVAGGSMGGSFAIQLAVSAPSRVQTLGLIDSTAWFGPNAATFWESRARDVEQKGMETLIEGQKGRWFSDRFRAQNPEAVDRCCSAFLANDVACFAATCRMLGSFDLRPVLAKIHVPTAVVVGEDDSGTPPEMSRELEKGIAGATLQLIPGARHFTFVETPEAVAEALSRLIERSVAVA